MDDGTFLKLSRYLCKHRGYYRVGGYDPATGLAWACRSINGNMFHINPITGLPAYNHTFRQVTGFQEGLACVRDDSGLWQYHIQPDGMPAYDNRFLSVGLFFEGLADAIDERGQFHIKPDGQPAYDQRFEHVGHFRCQLAQAKDATGHFHIKPDGTPAYQLRGLDNGPFNEHGIAWTKIVKIVDGKKIIARVLINTLGEIVT